MSRWKVNNCRLELENRSMLKRLREIPKSFKTFARPDSVSVDWHKTENQGPIGSCQGNDLASILERLQRVAGHIPETQLSRIFAYLATQRIDGLLGSDRGSTITGGIKLALTVGVCPESLTGYPKSYPGKSERSRILSENNYQQSAPYKAESKFAAPEDPDEARNLIGGGGAISVGIPWPGMPRDRIFHRYNGGRGGHAWALLGYDPEFLIAVNSHGDGPFKITNDAWRQMIRHHNTAAVGLFGQPEPEPLDWGNWT